MPRRRAGRFGWGPLGAWLVVAGVTAASLASPRSSSSRAQLVLDVTANISNSPTRDSRNPRVLVTRAGSVFVVWEEDGASQPSLSDVYYRFLPPGPGAAWQPAVPTPAARFAQSPALASFGADEVSLAYESMHPFEARQVQLKAWDVAGRRWPLVPQSLDGIGLDGVEPDLAFQPDGTLWMTWVSTRAGARRPYYARLANGTVRAGGTINACFSFSAAWPRLAVAADADAVEAVYVAWSDDQLAGGSSILMASRDLGETDWHCDDTELRYFEADPGFARVPDVAATEGGNVCVVWQEGDGPLGPGQNQEIIRACSPFENMSNESTSAARAIAPSLALAPTGVPVGALLMWELQQSKQVWFSQSAPPVKTPVRNNGHTPDLAFDARTGQVHAVWAEDGPSGQREVFYARWNVLPPTQSPTPGATVTRTATVTHGTAGTPSSTATPATPPGSTTPGTPTLTPTASETFEVTPTPPTQSPTAPVTLSPPTPATPTPDATPTPTPRGGTVYLALTYRTAP